MRIDVDISGQVTQRGLDSSLGFKRSDGVCGAVVLTAKTKKLIFTKYKGQVTNLVEKVHCILIYYCVRESLDGVTEIRVCRDVKFRAIGKLLPMLFRGDCRFSAVRITARREDEPKSPAHWPALRAGRRRKYANLIVKRRMIEEKLFDFR